MAYVSEVIASSHALGRSVRCPFSMAESHTGKCRCKGTRFVISCADCEGSGFDGKKNEPCRKCGGHGCFSAAQNEARGNAK
jgi:DnaJ-class molecular chaperone